MRFFLMLFLLSLFIGGCDGSESNTSGVISSTTDTSSSLLAASTYANQCSPASQYTSPNLKTGSLDTERLFLRSYFDEAYLWYNEVPAVNTDLPAYNQMDVYTSLENYFFDLKTPVLTASGKQKDRFSFLYPTNQWNALSRSGQTFGFGAEWYILSNSPPRDVRVAYVDPGTPAASAGITRGMKIILIDNFSVNTTDQTGIDLLNEALIRPTNKAYTFALQTPEGAFVTRTMTAKVVTKTPVLLVQTLNSSSGKTGYILFNDHLLPAEGQLVNAFNQLKQQNVVELILDLRYNGGGKLYIASQVGYMIAGSARTRNKTFEKLQFNTKRIADNNDPENTLPFFGRTSGFAGSGTSIDSPLPELGLGRVFIIAGPGTCSASESVINGLRGIDVPVILIGGTTCGKPYCFTATDNCGISYFPIEASGVNEKGFGDYADGFAPTCSVSDDFAHQLGDASEGRLSAAMYYIDTGNCPAASSMQALGLLPGEDGGRIARHKVRESKWR
jgi:hypothetical protein